MENNVENVETHFRVQFFFPFFAFGGHFWIFDALDKPGEILRTVKLRRFKFNPFAAHIIPFGYSIFIIIYRINEMQNGRFSTFSHGNVENLPVDSGPFRMILDSERIVSTWHKQPPRWLRYPTFFTL